MTLPDPAALLADAPRVRDALDAAGWSSVALEDLLGATARTHLDRDELAPVLRRTAGTDPLSALARLLVVGVPVDEAAARRSGLPHSWLEAADGGLACPVRLQPVAVGGTDLAVPHDPGRQATGVHPDQVLGVGAASLTLAAATPRLPVGRVLDVGAGSGVQALLAAPHAGEVVATDRNPRATAYTALAAALRRTRIDARTGDLLAPVEGEVFDLVVSNPPFVIGPQARYTYRDAGLDADDVCRRLVTTVPEVLAPGGTAVLLANWLHVQGEDGDARVASWVDTGRCDAWVVQRELAAPQDYVTAWLRDSDEGGRFDELYDAWVDWFLAHRVEAVAFGVVALRRTDRPGRVVLEDVDQAVAPAWGAQVSAHFAARDALAADLLACRLRLRPDVRLQEVGRPGPDGWYAEGRLLVQQEGLRHRGGVDEHGASLLAACDGTRPLGDLLAVLAAATGTTPGEASAQVLPVVRRLVEQGFLLP